jgi:hypothetical protein
MAVTLITLFIVCGFFGFSIFIQNEPVLQWYDKTLLILFYSSMAAFLYMCFIYYVLKLIGKINRSVLTLNKPDCV